MLGGGSSALQEIEGALPDTFGHDLVNLVTTFHGSLQNLFKRHERHFGVHLSHDDVVRLGKEGHWHVRSASAVLVVIQICVHARMQIG